MLALTYAAAIIATLPLLLILIHLIREGAAYIRPAFFTEMPRPIGEPGGGMSNAIVGTLILISLASVIGLPVGIGAGLYLAERRGSTLATMVRFLSDVLNGLPSIVMGIFAWEFLVRPIGHFSALAGGIALGAMTLSGGRLAGSFALATARTDAEVTRDQTSYERRRRTSPRVRNRTVEDEPVQSRSPSCHAPVRSSAPAVRHARHAPERLRVR